MNEIKKFYNTKRAQKIAISALAVILVIGGITLATLYTLALPSKTNVTITLASEESKTRTDAKVIINADVEIMKDKVLVEKVSMSMNKSFTLKTQLEVGEYTINIMSSPIENNGSTYKIPDKIDTIIVSDEDVKGNKAINIEVPLERIDVSDMKKEQLETTIKQISEKKPNENKKLIEELKKRQEKIVSNEAKAEDTPQANDTPKAETKSNTNTGSNSGSINKVHQHNWVANMVTIPATPDRWKHTYTADRTESIFIHTWVDGCIATILPDENGNTSAGPANAEHVAKHGEMDYTQVVETKTIPGTFTEEIVVPAQPERQEQHGYKCSCGATKE